MRVTEKGQVTIPKGIRDRLGIGPGSEVDFLVDDAGVVKLVRGNPMEGEKPIAGFDDWAERVRGLIDTGSMNGEDYVNWLRGPRDDIDPR